jgi:WD40 repeat protein
MLSWIFDDFSCLSPQQPKPKATSSPEHQLNVVRIKGFRHTVSCVKFSADGRYLAACSGERQTLVYFASTLLGKDHRWIQVNTDDETLYCDFDSNGNYLVLGLSDTKTVAAFQLLSKVRSSLRDDLLHIS